ncbi:VOC family protein [Nguyenibacter sp. L1]|uniref:VOC family protein n=1 Tax=Nguyenibacter sp. L1 TaxID=3049350 RepID=UPI0038D10D14
MQASCQIVEHYWNNVDWTIAHHAPHNFRGRLVQRLFLTAVLVRDYDEAIAFYVHKLGFEVRLDTKLSETKRWVVLAPHGGGQGCILLAKPEVPEQIDRIGSQTGGRVFLFLDTDDFQRDYDTYVSRGVSFSPAYRFFETPDKRVRNARGCQNDERVEERRETTGAWRTHVTPPQEGGRASSAAR